MYMHCGSYCATPSLLQRLLMPLLAAFVTDCRWSVLFCILSFAVVVVVAISTLTFAFSHTFLHSSLAALVLAHCCLLHYCPNPCHKVTCFTLSPIFTAGHFLATFCRLYFSHIFFATFFPWFRTINVRAPCCCHLRCGLPVQRKGTSSWQSCYLCDCRYLCVICRFYCCKPFFIVGLLPQTYTRTYCNQRATLTQPRSAFVQHTGNAICFLGAAARRPVKALEWLLHHHQHLPLEWAATWSRHIQPHTSAAATLLEK